MDYVERGENFLKILVQSPDYQAFLRASELGDAAGMEGYEKRIIERAEGFMALCISEITGRDIKRKPREERGEMVGQLELGREESMFRFIGYFTDQLVEAMPEIGLYWYCNRSS